MRRLTRHLFPLCSMLSFVLFVAACVLWVRSYTWMDRLDWTTAPEPTADDAFVCQAIWGVAADEVGRIYFFRFGKAFNRTEFPGKEMDDALDTPGFNWTDGARSGPFDRWRPAWFRWMRVVKDIKQYRMVRTQLDVPYWFVTIVLAVLPATAVIRWMRRGRRVREGCCQSCGYDLRASPDRCPECGAVTSERTA